MRFKTVGRLVLALTFAGIAGYFAYAFVTMPYEVVTTSSTYTRAIPDGVGTMFLAVVFGVLALVAAFSGDWG